MIVLIDAHNLLHQDSGLKKLYRVDYKKAFAELANMIDNYAVHNPKSRIYVIFDGFAPDVYPAFENMYIEESGNYQTADDLIKEYIKTSVNPKKIKVISSDREILAYAKNNYSEYYRSEDFIHELRFLTTTPISEQEENIYNKIKKENRQKPLLDVFSNSNLSSEELDDMHLNIPKETKDQILNKKSKKNRPVEKQNSETVDMISLKEHFKKSDSPIKKKKKTKQEKEDSSFDKINDLNNRFSDDEFKDIESWFK